MTNKFNDLILKDAINRVEECCAELITMVMTIPHLHIISTSNDKPQGDIMEMATKFGMEASYHVVSPQNVMTKLTELSENLNNKVIVQLPLENEEDYPRLSEMIDLLHPMQDVAGLKVPLLDITSMYDGNDFITHPTFSPVAKAVLLLNMLVNAEIKGKEVAIVGKGLIEDLSIKTMYSQLKSTVYNINYATQNLTKNNILCSADIIINCDDEMYIPTLHSSKIYMNTTDKTLDELTMLFIIYNCLGSQMTNELVMYNDELKRCENDVL